MTDQSNTPPDLQKLVTEWVTANFGVPGIIVLGFATTVGLIWWNWEKAAKLPGVAPLLALLFPEKEAPPTPLPRPKPDRLTVAVVHLDGDQNGEIERLIVEALSETTEVQVLKFDRLIAPTDGNIDDAVQAGHSQARSLLVEGGADVLIWGAVLRNGLLTLPKLRWTASHELPVESRARKYKISEELEFSDIFRSDLTEILDLLVLVLGAYFSPEKAPTRGPLPDFLRRIHKLLQEEGAQWPQATLQNLKFGFADLCLVQGVQDWKNDEWMRMAQDAYESAIPKDDTVWLYHKYLTAFYNLGQVYQYRGARLENRGMTEQAVHLFRRIAGITAVTDYPEDKWLYVASHAQLGSILSFLGKEDNDIEKLKEAVSAFRSVAGEYTPDFRRQIIVGLANTLKMIGESEPGTARLREAIAPYESAIREAPDEDSRKSLTEALQSIRTQIRTRSGTETEALE